MTFCTARAVVLEFQRCIGVLSSRELFHVRPKLCMWEWKMEKEKERERNNSGSVSNSV